MILTVDAQKPKSLFCKDWFFFGTAEMYHLETIFFKGSHKLSFKNLNSAALADVQANGLQSYMFCDGYAESFINVFKTVMGFLGGLGTNPNLPIIGSHIPEYMEKANVKFLNDTMNYELVKREVTDVEIDESLINSGDFLAILRLDGLDPLIMYGSGTRVGHSTMALRFDDGLYVIESQDGWYWPRHGIQRNKFSDWIKWAKNADFNVAHLPLNKAARANFNETAAQEFFFQT